MPTVPRLVTPQVAEAPLQIAPMQPVASGLSALGDGIANFGIAERYLQRNKQKLQATSLGIETMQEIEAFQIDLMTDTDYETQVDRFDQLVEQRRKQVSGAVDEEVSQLYSAAVASELSNKRFQIQQSSIKGQISWQRAILTDNLERLAKTAGTNDMEHESTVARMGAGMLDTAFGSGILTDPEEYQKLQSKFLSDLSVANVRRGILDDPEKAEREVLGDGYPDLQGDARTIWAERAQSAADSARRQRVAEEDRQLRLSDRQAGLDANAAERDGLELISDGEMDPQWIEDNRDTLSPSALKYFYGVLQGGTANTDIKIYAGLRERAGAGEDVTAEARNALFKFQIKREDYDRILGVIGTEGRKGWYRRGESYITRILKPSDLNPDPAAAQRHAKAMDDWYQWAAENPKVDDTKASQEFKRIVDEYAIIDFNQIALTLRMPKFATAPRLNMTLQDVAAAEDATVKALDEGTLTDTEFKRQAELLQQWTDALQRMQQQQQTRGEGNGGN